MRRLIISHIITALVGVFSVHYYQFLNSRDLLKQDIIPGCIALAVVVLAIAFTQAGTALRAQHAQTRIEILRPRKVENIAHQFDLQES